ncbi:MAG: DNA repair protein RecO [Acidobacteriia bacterium]|nr:DNA repair protein RecO [Terriglobia bacterium]
MSARLSESIVLRTFPLREADLIVSFLARDLGKLRGVARRARKPGNRFGSGLQRLSYVRMEYFHRENRDLDSLDGCEILRSHFGLASGYEPAAALDYFAEVADQLLPAAEPNEKFFRLLLAVSDYLDGAGEAGIWTAVTYYSLWAVRLGGFLPPMELSEEDRAIAEEMLRKPVAELTYAAWSKHTAIGLRRKLVRLLEDHIERKLLTAAFLEAL